MARKLILKDDGINNTSNSPNGYKFIGYDGEVISEKSGATISSIGGVELGYLRYIAELNQVGTDAPTANVLVNELGGTVVWSRSDVDLELTAGDLAGKYKATLVGAFAEKTHIIPPFDTYGADQLQINTYGVGIINADAIYLQTGYQDTATGVILPADGCLWTGYSFIEIRVYTV